MSSLRVDRESGGGCENYVDLFVRPYVCIGGEKEESRAAAGRVEWRKGERGT